MTSFLLSIKQFAGEAEPVFEPGIFDSLGQASEYFVDRAEQIVLKKDEDGDYICRILHMPLQQAISTFRVEKKGQMVLVHQLSCACKSCACLLRRGRADAKAEAVAAL